MTVLFKFIERSMKMTRRLPVWKVYERGIFSFLQKTVCKRVRGRTSGRNLPVLIFFSAPPPPPESPSFHQLIGYIGVKCHRESPHLTLIQTKYHLNSNPYPSCLTVLISKIKSTELSVCGFHFNTSGLCPLV